MPKLRNHRNFQIAHSIPEPFEPALIEDLLEISRQTEDIVSKIANASGIVAMDFGPSVRVWSDRADAFWKRLAGLTA